MEDQALPQRGYTHSISKRVSGGSGVSGGGSGSFSRAADAAIHEAAAEGAVAAVDGKQ
jgi:hypothetical protein